MTETPGEQERRPEGGATAADPYADPYAAPAADPYAVPGASTASYGDTGTGGYGDAPSAGSSPGAGYGDAPRYGQPPAYGEPAPAYGSGAGGPAAGGQLASWGQRALGYVVDLVIIFVVQLVVGLVAGRGVAQLVGLLVWVGFAYMESQDGQSPGKKVVGIRLRSERDGSYLSWGMAIVRKIAHLVDTLPILIGWLWPLWDRKRQTFADKIVSTVVTTG